MIIIRPTNTNHDMNFFKEMVTTVESVIEENGYNSLLDITMTGMAKMMEEQQSVLKTRIMLVTMVSLLLIVIMFAYFYKRVMASLFAVTPIVIAIVWTLGINYLVIGRLNLVTSIFSVIMLGLGVDFSIHYLSPLLSQTYKSASSSGVIHILEKYSRSIFASALTTSVAFLL